MSNKEFQYHLSNLDMKDFYNDMLCSHMNCPAVIVMDELEDGSNILRREMENGNQLIYLKNADNMFTVFKNELALNKATVVPALPFENHNLENEDLMTWIACAVEIADLLSVKCPQIIFTPFENAANAAGEGVIFIPAKEPSGKLNILENFVCIAHELRHEWQHVNHPDWFEGYVHVEGQTSEDQMDAYLNHRTEIDAEAYARKLAGMVFDVPLFGKKDKKLLNQAQEIKMNISEEQIEYLAELFDTDDWDDVSDECYEYDDECYEMVIL